MTAGRVGIGWIGDPGDPERGRWGEAGALTLPLDDRGLLLADGLFETLLLERGRIQLLAEHLQRWRDGARLLGLPPPPDGAALRALAEEAVSRSGIRSGALRLNWSRGSTGRGLDLPAEEQVSPRFWLQLTAAAPQFEPLNAIISRRERRNPSSLLSRCKTFAYGAQVQARREAREAGADEALMLSCAGELSCGAAANLLLRIGDHWFTPPLASGCLPGVMRGRALALGRAREARLLPADLFGSGGALLINSLGCRPLHRCDGQRLPGVDQAEAKALWRSLLAVEGLSCSPAQRCDR